MFVDELDTLPHGHVESLSHIIHDSSAKRASQVIAPQSIEVPEMPVFYFLMEYRWVVLKIFPQLETGFLSKFSVESLERVTVVTKLFHPAGELP